MSVKTDCPVDNGVSDTPETPDKPTIEQTEETSPLRENWELANLWGDNLQSRLENLLIPEGTGTRGQAMMGQIIGLVVAVSVGLVITFQLLPTVFESWDSLQDGEEALIPENLEGLVELIPVFGVLAIALVFLGALMRGVRGTSNNGGF